MPETPEVDEFASRQAALDPNLALHGRAVGRYATIIARQLRLAPDPAEQLRLAGELHDVGKLAVPRNILDKPGPIDRHEWAQIHTHPVMGGRMLRSAGLPDIADWVFDHHERPDGRGYPSGISLISLEARILAVAEAYHAMITDRPYKAAMSHTEAAEELRLAAGAQFDPAVVRAFLGALQKLTPGDPRCSRL
jgi:HD-GYP domain-containing protein (c-di-GMP phosphodiesterase class II)